MKNKRGSHRRNILQIAALKSTRFLQPRSALFYMTRLHVLSNRSKAPDKKSSGQKPPDNKPPRIIEEFSTKYAVDANLVRLGSTNAKKCNPAPGFFLGFYTGGLVSGGFGQGG